jgi:hypothetical protein
MCHYVSAGVLRPLNDILTASAAAEGEKGDLSATQDDIARVIETIRIPADHRGGDSASVAET